VGQYQTRELERAFAAIHWNGRTWDSDLDAVPNRGGELNAISCASADSSVAIGSIDGQQVAQMWQPSKGSLR
jgi:hypothetical protein